MLLFLEKRWLKIDKEVSFGDEEEIKEIEKKEKKLEI